MVNPKKHDALWCLGNANTSYAFLTPDQEEARSYFDKSALFFQQAVDEVNFGYSIRSRYMHVIYLCKHRVKEWLSMFLEI